MPKQFRNMCGCSVSNFKHHLHKYLNTIPGNSCAANYVSNFENFLILTFIS